MARYPVVALGHRHPGQGPRRSRRAGFGGYACHRGAPMSPGAGRHGRRIVRYRRLLPRGAAAGKGDEQAERQEAMVRSCKFCLPSISVRVTIAAATAPD